MMSEQDAINKQIGEYATKWLAEHKPDEVYDSFERSVDLTSFQPVAVVKTKSGATYTVAVWELSNPDE
jgi:hypothetical protein